MTLSGILSQIKLQYPRASVQWTDNQIVDFLNIEQNNIFSELQIEATYDFKTVKDTARYTLPADMEIPSIEHVLTSTSVSTSAQSGTVSVVAGTKTVTGSGTSFTSALAGAYIVINDELKCVSSETPITSTSLTVTTNFDASTSGALWYLYTTPTETVTFTEQPYADYNVILTRQTPCGWYKFSDLTTDYIGFYPVPATTGKTIRVIYRIKPTAMVNSVGGLVLEPDLHYRWHNLLVFAAISEIASSGSNPDVTLANNYAMKYNALLKMAKENRFERDKPGYSAKKNVFRSHGRARRILSGHSRNFPRYSSYGDN